MRKFLKCLQIFVFLNQRILKGTFWHHLFLYPNDCIFTVGGLNERCQELVIVNESFSVNSGTWRLFERIYENLEHHFHTRPNNGNFKYKGEWWCRFDSLPCWSNSILLELFKFPMCTAENVQCFEIIICDDTPAVKDSLKWRGD